jgi:hypothetical protein
MVTTPTPRKFDGPFNPNGFWQESDDDAPWQDKNGSMHGRNDDYDRHDKDHDWKHDNDHDWKDGGGKHASKDDHEKYDKGHDRKDNDYKHDKGHDWKDGGGKHARKDDHDKNEKGHGRKDDDYDHDKGHNWKDDGGKHARKDDDCNPSDNENEDCEPHGNQNDGYQPGGNCEPECPPTKEIVCKDPCTVPEPEPCLEPCTPPDPCEVVMQLCDPGCDTDQSDLHSALASMSDVSSVVEFAIGHLGAPETFDTASFGGLEGADTFHDALAS